MKYLRTAKKHYPGEDSFHPDGYRMLFLLVLSHKYQIAVDMQFVFKLNLLSNLRSKCYVLLRTSVIGVRVLDSQTQLSLVKEKRSQYKPLSPYDSYYLLSTLSKWEG